MRGHTKKPPRFQDRTVIQERKRGQLRYFNNNKNAIGTRGRGQIITALPPRSISDIYLSFSKIIIFIWCKFIAGELSTMGESGGGGCCPPMDLMRSEPMQLVQLIVPMESAHLTVSYLGDLGLVQFKDVRNHFLIISLSLSMIVD